MGKVREGSATFWRSSRFRKLAGRDIRLRNTFVDGHVLFQPLLDASPELQLALQKVTTIAQATLLAPMPGASDEGRHAKQLAVDHEGTGTVEFEPWSFEAIQIPILAICHHIWGIHQDWKDSGICWE